MPPRLQRSLPRSRPRRPRRPSPRAAWIVAATLALVGCDAPLAADERAPPRARPAAGTPAPGPGDAPAVDDDGAMAFVDDPAEADVDPALAARAQVLWDTRCAACHGPRGDGEGAARGGEGPPPRDFHRRAWQRATADAHIERVLVGGGAAVGLSPGMPAIPELADPELRAAMIAILRGLPHWQPTPAGVQAP